MTESDNTEVKKFIEPKKEHTDEFLTTIKNLWANTRSGRRMFASREIKPVITVGQYNSQSEKYEPFLGTEQISIVATSAAAHTLTCPAGKRYKVKFCSSQDDTTAPTSMTLSGTLNGTAVTWLVQGSYDAAQIATLVGSVFGAGTGGALWSAILLPITLNGGDTLTATAGGFQVADVRSTTFVYEEFVL